MEKYGSKDGMSTLGDPQQSHEKYTFTQQLNKTLSGKNKKREQCAKSTVCEVQSDRVIVSIAGTIHGRDGTLEFKFLFTHFIVDTNQYKQTDIKISFIL
uniref:NTF2 domain-containing protein n=1 Tax=Anguilla anguilla TaxID=7936 RepID=A0A0E9X5W9_ANGAN